MREFEQDFRFATSFARMLPDFIIAGEAKCGTTSLYHYLTQHPRILRADLKEPTNFLKYGGSVLLCRLHYPFMLWRWLGRLMGRRIITGEASPEYFSKSVVPENILHVVPRVKIIVLLRNPVTRAYSDHQMFARNKPEYDSFETFARRSVDWIRDDRVAPLVEAVSQLEYHPARFVHRGLYVVPARRWLGHFPKENILFLKSEDLFEDPQRVTDGVAHYLGLHPHPLKDASARKKGRYSSALTAAAVRLLGEFYRPYNEQLYELLGRDFGWEAETEQLLRQIEGTPSAS
jgi:hypothetical protein